MYEAYFGLRECPFDLTPNPRFLFMTPGHREALSTIQYGIAGRKGVTLLVGPAGTGKTTLIYAALGRQSGTHDAKALFLTNPTLTRAEFFEFLALELGLSAQAERSKTHFLRELTATLIQRRETGALTALIVDEAQAMPDELLEEVRLLANLETITEKLLPVVLVGQLELAGRLQDQRLQQLKQRVALRSTLAPLTRQETAAYVAERIRIAGGDVRSVFTADAIASVFEGSGGIPRTISVLCDNALVSGFALDQRPIGKAVIDEVRSDFDLHLNTAAAVAVAGAATPVATASEAEPAVVDTVLAAPSVRADGDLLQGLVALPDVDEPEHETESSSYSPRRALRAVFGRMVSR